MTAPLLVFGWGNPSRGDDALGPLFIEQFEQLVHQHPEWGEIDYLTDFQLQVEHALDLQNRRRVLFVDASRNAPAPCTLHAIQPHKDASFSTHAMSAQTILQVYADIHDSAPPPTWQLAIRGVDFELGAPLSNVAQEHLHAALAIVAAWMDADMQIVSTR
ncbi:MAG TPA: hydrogenase maturation protease [Rhodocyclaceae bacterium]|nr:hydrogenase maturation protease [Rhodocyclaceae bacterium]